MPVYNTTPSWQQTPCYPEPVRPPSTAPDSFPQVCLQFGVDWLPYVLGALQQLAQPTTWLITSPPPTLTDVLSQVNTLLDIVSAAAVCAVAPACAGMDPGHESTFAALFGPSGALSDIRVGAGRTAGGTPISYAQQDIAIPGGVPGSVAIGVDSAGILGGFGGTTVPATHVQIAQITIAGTSGKLGLGAPGTNDMFADTSGAVHIAPFVVTDPITYPSAVTIPASATRNPLTPPADFVGWYSSGVKYVAADPYNALALAPLAVPAAYATGLCPLQLVASTNNDRNAVGYTSPWTGLTGMPIGIPQPLAVGAFLTLQPPGPIFGFPDPGTGWANGGQVFAHGNGDPRWESLLITGFPDNFAHYSSAVSPIGILVQLHLSTC